MIIADLRTVCLKAEFSAAPDSTGKPSGKEPKKNMVFRTSNHIKAWSKGKKLAGFAPNPNR
jgi:hypothetical protein